MEQTRKLLADAFDKDPIKQQYCIFHADHLLAVRRISPEITVSVLSTVAANATNDTVRLDALRTMPQLIEQKNYQDEPNRFLSDPFPARFPPGPKSTFYAGNLISKPWLRPTKPIERRPSLNCRPWIETGALSIAKPEATRSEAASRCSPDKAGSA